MFTDDGAAFVSVAPFMKIPAIAPHVSELINSEILSEMPTIDVSNLESIVAGLSVMRGHKQDNDRVGFGTAGIEIRTTTDIDWTSAITSTFPGSREEVEQKTKFIELKEDVLSPTPIRLVPRDARQLQVFMPTRWPVEETYGGFPAAVRTTMPDWADEWNAVSGGVATLFWRIPLRTGENPHSDEFMSVGWELQNAIDSCAYGFDIDKTCETIAMRLRIRCRKGVDSDEVTQKLQRVLKIFEEDCRDEVANSEHPVLEKLWLDSIAIAKPVIVTKATATGRGSVLCTLNLHISPELLLSLTANK